MHSTFKWIVLGLLGLGYSPHCYRGLVESHLVGADLKNEKLFQLMVALAFVSLPGISYHFESFPDVLYHLVPLPFSALLEMAGGRGDGPGLLDCTHTTSWYFFYEEAGPLFLVFLGLLSTQSVRLLCR